MDKAGGGVKAACAKGAAHVIRFVMAGPPRSKPNEHADRLAAALRDNLRRRKAQARAIDDAPEPPEVPPPAGEKPGQ